MHSQLEVTEMLEPSFQRTPCCTEVAVCMHMEMGSWICLSNGRPT